MPPQDDYQTPENEAAHCYTFASLPVAELTAADVEQRCATPVARETRALNAITPEALTLNHGTFSRAGGLAWPTVAVVQQERSVLVSCTCAGPAAQLCEHQAQVLLAVLHRSELRIFFDAKLRQDRLRAAAKDYGLEQETNLEAHLQLTYTDQAVTIAPIRASLLPITAATKQELIRQLLPEQHLPEPNTAQRQRFIVLGRHRYYGHLTIQLVEAATTAAGNPKNPLTFLNPLDGIWNISDPDALKFYTGLARFQHNYDDARTGAALEALRAVVKNPEGIPVLAHRSALGEKVTAQSVEAVRVHHVRLEMRLLVTQQAEFYQVTGKLHLLDQLLELRDLTIQHEYFVAVHGELYLLDSLEVWRVVEFFKQHNNALLIHQSKFDEFQREVLTNLEDRLRITYSYVRPATRRQLQEAGFDQTPELVLYLSDAGLHVELLPVMRYGTREVSVLSRRQLYATDVLGRPFVVVRDAAAEERFLQALVRQYPIFQEQLAQQTLYMPKAQFLDENWFLDAFESWQAQHIMVLGFNQLRQNTLNRHKARISVQVSSETNWFETKVQVRFGSQQASLRQLQRAVRNRSRYVHLDDGTRGILPQEWVEKFATYFRAGQVVEEQLRTPAVSFASVEELYEEAMLTTETKARLAEYRTAVASFAGIGEVAVPAALRATLRGYQQQGLNWLTFLDSFGFGGCLADDMGLGKTVQVLAFVLQQLEQGRTGASLVVVPTSLLFNWQAEIAKFAPSLRVHVAYGSGRSATMDYAAYAIVLTTYTTLVADIKQLKEYRFNYVFLDEAQAIKNPDSLRYKAACLLQARNRVVLTGTPLENNTYDLYGQLSFACPGLLGTRQQFRAHFADPIDKFKDGERARELQRKISPFVLRRTKAQVASELPEKTEMVLYCEMGAEQRRVYEACKQEYRDLLLGQLDDGVQRESLHILQGITRLRQICNSPALLRTTEDYGHASAKLEVLVEEIRNKAPEHKILVFSQFVAMLDLIRYALQAHDIPSVTLTGQTRNRAGAVTAFQEDESTRVFLVSLKAGGTGLNLTAADYVFLVDPWWNPAVENQAIDRSYRIGQTKHVVAVRLICPDTIEERMMQLQEGKRELAHELIRTDTALLKSLTKQELLALFS
ncbi:DEAD/DEAH box helicase [Hymenobacter sp. AT01-02]|uniref:DEAD/DEAH box helicase n=1 Tax=Hymenobacter sp. AT01-02 TaxID=1571877 RepID=UPI0006E18ECC|nr:DEAD/DEAH box helicase [Hymenobacter sp. AT01-02]